MHEFITELELEVLELGVEVKLKLETAVCWAGCQAKVEMGA